MNHYRIEVLDELPESVEEKAPEFDIKCGFKAEFTRENGHNPSLNKTFFVKFFDDAIQTQGLKQVTKGT